MSQTSRPRPGAGGAVKILPCTQNLKFSCQVLTFDGKKGDCGSYLFLLFPTPFDHHHLTLPLSFHYIYILTLASPLHHFPSLISLTN
ncbi:hypothetical protein RIF29_12865 [Crotalaria pallida]|uniref:Uncharacterized protein n=1 Tax=Crotalaria pallida TaxID=3830 RepID=A0AAN9P271_CROPI